jgi:stage II sporulation protein D
MRSVLVTSAIALLTVGMHISPSAAALPSDVRIRILSSRHPVSITLSSADGMLFLKQGTVNSDLCEIKLSKVSMVITSRGKIYTESFTAYRAKGLLKLSFNDSGTVVKRTYRGAIEVNPEKNELCVINSLPFEDFVHDASVSETGDLINNSMTRDQKKTLLSAMEVCIRSFLAAESSRHTGAYQFCDLTHCVHYEGYASGSVLTAAKIISGADAKPVRAYFHSTCGGRLTGPEVFWERSSVEPYYRRAEDIDEKRLILCSHSPHAKWNFFLKDDSAVKIFGLKPKDIRIEKRDGRATILSITDESGKMKTMPIAAFMSDAGRMLGWNSIKSNDFSVAKKQGGWLFTGFGLGHGVGLCQYGAQTLAKKGRSYEDILAFYFPGTKIVKADH